jgi:hypothetical protein
LDGKIDTGQGSSLKKFMGEGIFITELPVNISW